MKKKKMILFTMYLISLWGVPAIESMAFQIIQAEIITGIKSNMYMPTDVTLGEKGAVYIVDGYRNRIVLRQPDGSIRIIEPDGACALKKPLGITFHKGSLYVANTGAGTICELDPMGRCLRVLPMTGTAKDVAGIPTDIAIQGDRAVIADRGRNTLRFFLYPSFKPVQDVGEFNPKIPALNAPYLLDFKLNQVIVTDMLNGRLVMFDRHAQFLNKLDERGVREGQFIRPKGVAVEKGGDIFVSDSTLGVVQVFNDELKYIGTIGKGEKPHHFQHPAGLAAADGMLAVVEQRANKVTLLRVRVP